MWFIMKKLFCICVLLTSFTSPKVLGSDSNFLEEFPIESSNNNNLVIDGDTETSKKIQEKEKRRQEEEARFFDSLLDSLTDYDPEIDALSREIADKESLKSEHKKNIENHQNSSTLPEHLIQSKLNEIKAYISYYTMKSMEIYETIMFMKFQNPDYAYLSHIEAEEKANMDFLLGKKNPDYAKLSDYKKLVDDFKNTNFYIHDLEVEKRKLETEGQFS
jgi:hypothetical protein